MLPAISPDGSKLAYAASHCCSQAASRTSPTSPAIQAGDQGDEHRLRAGPAAAGGRSSAGAFPYLSSVLGVGQRQPGRLHAAVQDNEGWGLNLVNTVHRALLRLPGPGVTAVPVTGSPDAQRSYIREGIMPERQLVHQPGVLRRVPGAQHIQADVGGDTSGGWSTRSPSATRTWSMSAWTSSGHWLLYLAGTSLYVSQDGNAVQAQPPGSSRQPGANRPM